MNWAKWRRVNTTCSHLHRIKKYWMKVYSHIFVLKKILTKIFIARQMIDTVRYARAHGADGYTRYGLGLQKTQRNVLYKLLTTNSNFQWHLFSFYYVYMNDWLILILTDNFNNIVCIFLLILIKCQFYFNFYF